MTSPIGQHYFPKRLATRLAAGAWCCGSFFLVQIYCSTLTSHLTSPNQRPIVNSFFEIADNPGVSLTIDRGFALDIMLQVMLQLISLKKYKHFYGSRYPLTLFFEQSTESVSIKRFTDTLRNADRLITCNTTNNCLKYVRGGNAVYAAVSCNYIYRW